MPGLRVAILILILMTACGQALAQFGRRGGGGDNGMRGRGDSSGELSGVTHMSANDQVRMQMTDLRLALKLAPEQNPMFDAYQGKVFDLLNDLSRGTIDTPSGEPAPKQIDHKVDTVRNRLAAMEDLSDAAKKLYAALTDEQRKVADRMLAGTVPALYSGQPGATPRGGRY